jgi:hypothetical protein
VKRTAGMSSRLRKIKNWTMWRGRAPSEMEKEIAHEVGAGNVGAPATRHGCPHRWKRKTLDNGDAPGLTGTLAGSHSG